MVDERRIALLVLMDVEEKKAYSNLALNHHLSGSKPPAKALTRRLVYGVLENKLYLDYIIDHFLQDKGKSPGTLERNILRLGIYQLAFVESIPSYAAVSETVNLAKKYKKGMEGFVNAILRNYLRSGRDIELPKREENESRYLSIKYSYNTWIVDMWLKEYGAKFTEELLAAGNEIPDLAIRPNLLKTTKEDLKTRLQLKEFQVQDGRLSSLALRVKGEELLATDLYKDGLFSVQDESSMVAVEILEPEAGELILDVCAAPGGKTMYIGEKMRNTGRIIARDIYTKKLNQLDAEAKRLGIDIVETEVWDAVTMDGRLEEKADRVLIDAPCTGLGTVRRKPEIKYKNEEDIAELPNLQGRILSSSSKYVKKGGILVYCTCTINPKENGDITREFLKVNEKFEKLEEIQLLANINNTDGFYICKMRRL